MRKIYVSWEEIFEKLQPIDTPDNVVYGVPKNGMILSGFLTRAKKAVTPDQANTILDDIVDTGRTRDHYLVKYPEAKFVALFSKHDKNDWFVFPWEREQQAPFAEETIEENVVRLIQSIGDDPTREGLKDTPRRVARMWREIFSGYNDDPPISQLLTVFENEHKYDQIVLCKDIEFYSMCEHHLLPFFGKAHVAYLPNDKIVGLSKLARVVERFARRLQCQETICEQVTDALMTHLKPKGAACVIEATHLCMRMRGIQKQNSVVVTSSVRGVFQTSPDAKQELFSLIFGAKR